MRKNLKLVLFILIFGVIVAGSSVAAPADTQAVSCLVNGLGDAIGAPGGVSIAVDRLSSGVSGSGTLWYTTENAAKTIVVAAAVTGGVSVTGAKLLIKGGDLSDYTLLITGATPESAVTLDAILVPGAELTIENIVLKLDASGVAAGASALGVPWVYTVTYTMQ